MILIEFMLYSCMLGRERTESWSFGLIVLCFGLIVYRFRMTYAHRLVKIKGNHFFYEPYASVNLMIV